MSSANEVELTAHGNSSNTGKGESQNKNDDVKVESPQESVKPVSVRTLFFKYASKKEIAILLLGFFCTFISVHIIDSCNLIRSADASFPNILWRTVR